MRYYLKELNEGVKKEFSMDLNSGLYKNVEKALDMAVRMRVEKFLIAKDYYYDLKSYPSKRAGVIPVSFDYELIDDESGNILNLECYLECSIDSNQIKGYKVKAGDVTVIANILSSEKPNKQTFDKTVKVGIEGVNDVNISNAIKNNMKFFEDGIYEAITKAIEQFSASFDEFRR